MFLENVFHLKALRQILIFEKKIHSISVRTPLNNRFHVKTKI